MVLSGHSFASDCGLPSFPRTLRSQGSAPYADLKLSSRLFRMNEERWVDSLESNAWRFQEMPLNENRAPEQVKSFGDDSGIL
ncbi:hypothetical protein VNO77_03750 [Canavalia gladiata]|uniref:Uncharacterized protein n=1 Tax=Canavalia gladiata TaxID=3824 RepID=A0AAN9MXB2_CANGL